MRKLRALKLPSRAYDSREQSTQLSVRGFHRRWGCSLGSKGCILKTTRTIAWALQCKRGRRFLIIRRKMSWDSRPCNLL